MWDSLRILINDIKRAQFSRSVRGTRRYHYLAGVAQTPKLSRVLDGANHVLNRLGVHGFERIRGDVVERERGRIRAIISIVIRPLLIREFAPTVFGQVARLMTKRTRGSIVNRTRTFGPLNHLAD